jgi:tetratricopeptide (TPR) repeat protein
MRIKRILWVLAAFAFSSFLYAQRTSVPGQGQPATQPQRPGSQMEENETSEQPNQGQTAKRAQRPSKGPIPLTEKEVTKEIKNSPAETVIKDVQQRGVDFDMTPDIEKKLRKVKATDEVVEAVRRAGPKVREQTAKMTMGASPAAGRVDVPKEQVQAFDVIKSELDPDKAITLVTDFATKYPQSPLLSYVYSYGANAYQQKGDVEKVVELTQKGLTLKSDNLMCLILSLGMLPQPQYLNNHAAEREKILEEAASEANRALQLIAQLPKQPNEADADHQKRLVQISSPVHASLGMVHLDLATEALAGPDKDELAKSEQEFNTAVAIDRPDPRDYYRMGEAYALDGKVDDAIGAFTKASQYGQGTMIKAYADQRVEELKKKKAQSPAAPKP